MSQIHLQSSNPLIELASARNRPGRQTKLLLVANLQLQQQINKETKLQASSVGLELKQVASLYRVLFLQSPWTACHWPAGPQTEKGACGLGWLSPMHEATHR